MSSQLQACARNIEKTMYWQSCHWRRERGIHPITSQDVTEVSSQAMETICLCSSLLVGDPGKVPKNMFTISPHKDGSVDNQHWRTRTILCHLSSWRRLNNEGLEFGAWRNHIYLKCLVKSAAASVFRNLSLLCRTFLNFFLLPH